MHPTIVLHTAVKLLHRLRIVAVIGGIALRHDIEKDKEWIEWRTLKEKRQSIAA
jgi:hypothetical protein